jgi:hypothetical protein
MIPNTLIVAAALATAFAVLQLPADPAKIEIPFGYLLKDDSCPDATYILKYPCPGLGGDYYLSFAKPRADLAGLEGQNVAVRGVVRASVCTLPLVQVTKVTASAILPPCPSP